MTSSLRKIVIIDLWGRQKQLYPTRQEERCTSIMSWDEETTVTMRDADHDIGIR